MTSTIVSPVSLGSKPLVISPKSNERAGKSKPDANEKIIAKITNTLSLEVV